MGRRCEAHPTLSLRSGHDVGLRPWHNPQPRPRSPTDAGTTTPAHIEPALPPTYSGITAADKPILTCSYPNCAHTPGVQVRLHSVLDGARSLASELASLASELELLPDMGSALGAAAASLGRDGEALAAVGRKAGFRLKQVGSQLFDVNAEGKGS